MVAAADCRHATRRDPSPWSAMAELAARINSAEFRMMTLIADFDRRRGWRDGFSSCAEWLAWRIGIKIGPARERVRTARALVNLPQTADALREGRISYAKVRAITRVATPGSEAELLEFARAGSAAKLEQTVRMWRKLSREGEPTVEEARHRSRTFSVFVDGDGMCVVRGRLEPEAGAVLMRAVEAASDALFRREGGAGDARPEPKHRGRSNTPEQEVRGGSRKSPQSVPPSLPPVPSGHSGAPAGASAASSPPVPSAARANLFNGAALHRDSAIPWAIEAAARQAGRPGDQSFPVCPATGCGVLRLRDGAGRTSRHA